jgi:hypothetical protein
MKWGDDGEPLVGHVPENVGDKWSEYGATGIGFKGVDNHAEATNIAPCLGSRCKQLHGEKWGADGEPLDGHTRENIGDKWSEYGASGFAFPGVDQHVATKLPPCLGAKCKQLHGEKVGGRRGASGWPHAREHRRHVGRVRRVRRRLSGCGPACCHEAASVPRRQVQAATRGKVGGRRGASGWPHAREHRRHVGRVWCVREGLESTG